MASIASLTPNAVQIGSERQARFPVAEVPLQHEVVAGDVEVDAAPRVAVEVTDLRSVVVSTAGNAMHRRVDV